MIPSTAERGSLLRSKPIGIPSPGRGAHGRARSPVRGAGVPRTAGAPHSSGAAAAARFIAASRSPGAPAHKTRAFRAASAGQAPSTSYGGSTSTSAGGSGSDMLRKRVAGAVARDAGAGAADAGARRRKLYACLALLVVAGAGVQIYMRRALAALHNYSYFVFQSGAIAYFPIVLGVTLFKLAFTKVCGCVRVAEVRHKSGRRLPLTTACLWWLAIVDPRLAGHHTRHDAVQARPQVRPHGTPGQFGGLRGHHRHGAHHRGPANAASTGTHAAAVCAPPPLACRAC